MPECVPTPTDDPIAAGLLQDYFDSRELGFTSHPGGYKVQHPDPKAFVPPRGLFLVVLDDAGEPVGCGGIRRISDRDNAPTFEVKHVWLAPEARGLGWSRLLMEQLEAAATGFGGTWLVLDTNESLEVAQHLYRTSGYEDIPAYNTNPNANCWLGKRLVHRDSERWG
jgi:ribosomal protein S18 acetylase RimI-like enzyme